MSAETGLRERKKEQTRQAIADAALRLFSRRGFEAVTVAEVAKAADVSEGTVFNYFPTKEDLFYRQMESFESRLVDAVRERPVGESVLAAFRRFVLESSTRLAAEETADVIATTARIVAASPTLQAREREIVAEYTRALASVIADETGAPAADTVPLVVAGALMGAQRALVDHVRSSVLSGQRGSKLAAGMRAQAKRVFARLEDGLADYAVRRR